MALSAELEDEISAVNAIYGDATLAVRASAGAATHCILSPPPSHPLHAVCLLLSFPPTYPAAPPCVLGPHSVGPLAPKGAGAQAAAIFASALAAAAAESPGQVCIYAALESCETTLVEAPAEPVEPAKPVSQAESAEPDRGFEPAWVVTPPAEVHKSVFVGRACRVGTAEEVAAATAALMQDKRVARATHNIRAWRLRGPPEHQESDDDGESAAGARVLTVAAGMDAWDVLVVVSRWYGGVKLGPERFRIIGRVAREALVLGGWDVQQVRGKAKS